jgi:Glyoxalase-like domain
MCFMPVADPKTVKNRMHVDLTSSAADRDREIERLPALGARHTRIDLHPRSDCGRPLMPK